ncbi:hypothetical protein CIHG_03809 [Coccidioides immitis H538.4]|uniref:Uncharacterized protein n=2 Tax=Coccidioides immitis TaxID=5501 RepID=A0A0J8RP49_COCIT|nr:hypothetical protein CIRG_04990 [Coccidioides immitis RMSCC 2394]KMU85769.1 hypothetical protein CIHG_03809 [Coccidioides immitis H538.4]
MAAFESTSVRLGRNIPVLIEEQSSLGSFLHLGHRYDEDDKIDMDCPGKRDNKSYIREDRRNGFRNGEEDPSFCGRKQSEVSLEPQARYHRDGRSMVTNNPKSSELYQRMTGSFGHQARSET